MKEKEMLLISLEEREALIEDKVFEVIERKEREEREERAYSDSY